MLTCIYVLAYENLILSSFMHYALYEEQFVNKLPSHLKA